MSDTPTDDLFSKIRAIAAAIETQDNRATDAPFFAVQQKKIVAGLEDGYAEKYVWISDDGDYSEADTETAAVLESKFYESFSDEIDGYRRVGIAEEWEFVTGCFTEQGCKDHIATNGHNLKEPRIFAYGSFRNFEFRAVREFLLQAPKLFDELTASTAKVSELQERVKVLEADAEWQPIEVAPRDGRPLLLRFGSDGVSQGNYVPGIPRPWKFIDTNDGITWIINYAIDGPGGPSRFKLMPK